MHLLPSKLLKLLYFNWWIDGVGFALFNLFRLKNNKILRFYLVSKPCKKEMTEK